MNGCNRNGLGHEQMNWVEYIIYKFHASTRTLSMPSGRLSHNLESFETNLSNLSTYITYTPYCSKTVIAWSR